MGANYWGDVHKQEFGHWIRNILEIRYRDLLLLRLEDEPSPIYQRDHIGEVEDDKNFLVTTSEVFFPSTQILFRKFKTIRKGPWFPMPYHSEIRRFFGKRTIPHFRSFRPSISFSTRKGLPSCPPFFIHSGKYRQSQWRRT